MRNHIKESYFGSKAKYVVILYYKLESESM